MSHSRLRTTLVAAALTVLPLVAGCGGSTPTTPATGGASTSASTPSSSTSTTTAADASAAGYCQALKDGQKELDGISGKISDSAALKEGLAVLAKIQEAAPPEVEQSWADFASFIEAAAKGDTTDAEAMVAKMSAATTKIGEHAMATCGIDMS